MSFNTFMARSWLLVSKIARWMASVAHKAMIAVTDFALARAQKYLDAQENQVAKLTKKQQALEKELEQRGSE